MAMWISRKLSFITQSSDQNIGFRRASEIIDRIHKPLPSIDDIDTTVLIVSGASNTGKSTLIRFGLQDLIAKHDSNLPDLQCHHTRISLDSTHYPVDIIEMTENHLSEDIPKIHGGLVCYDTTDRDSFDCIPDLLDLYLSRDIPVYLVGLKSDLPNKVDPLLVDKITHLFHIEHFTVDALSDRGVQTIQNLFIKLLGLHFPDIAALHENRSCEVTTDDTSGAEADPESDSKRTTMPFSYCSRRGSKDSSDSFGAGLTVEDIIDRLLTTEYGKTDENMIPIFLTFFRKFMRPSELVDILVCRFEKEGISDSMPTKLQKRIHCIFSLWLSNYWNDFYSSNARKRMILFLDGISKHESLTPICDSLAPLVVREPPSEDPDITWGMPDNDDEEHIKRKKDSAYASGTFSMSNFIQQELLHCDNKKQDYQTRPSSKVTPTTRSLSQKSATRCAEFAGGLVNIDNLKGPEKSFIQREPSVATGWTSTLGHQLLAASFISSLRNRTEKDQYRTFLKLSESAIADQLTWIEAELFSRIKPREFIRNIWSDNSIKSSSNNTVQASIAHFNFISAWVVTMIVTQHRTSKRVALLAKFMAIAVELRNNNNYNSLMAILAGINSASVLRLKQTRQSVSTKKIYKKFQSLERLMSSDRSFSSYRLALKASGAPGVPYLGIHNQDLVSLAEANKDFRTDGTVHWEKFRLMGETIMSTMKFKYPGYHIQPDKTILALIADSPILSEDEQYKRSITIEPRFSNGNRIRDLWLRI